MNRPDEFMEEMGRWIAEECHKIECEKQRIIYEISKMENKEG